MLTLTDGTFKQVDVAPAAAGPFGAQASVTFNSQNYATWVPVFVLGKADGVANGNGIKV